MLLYDWVHLLKRKKVFKIFKSQNKYKMKKCCKKKAFMYNEDNNDENLNLDDFIYNESMDSVDEYQYQSDENDKDKVRIIKIIMTMLQINPNWLNLKIKKIW